MDSTVVLMGHGTDHESHSAYPAIEYYFRDMGEMYMLVLLKVIQK